MMKEKGDGAESGSGDCRTSNKIILTTRLNYTRGTNNNIWPARIPAINIEPGGDRPLRPSWPVSIHRSFPNPRLHGLPRRLTSTMQSKTMGPGCGLMEEARRGVGWGGERQRGGGEGLRKTRPDPRQGFSTSCSWLERNVGITFESCRYRKSFPFRRNLFLLIILVLDYFFMRPYITGIHNARE